MGRRVHVGFPLALAFGTKASHWLWLAGTKATEAKSQSQPLLKSRSLSTCALSRRPLYDDEAPAALRLPLSVSVGERVLCSALRLPRVRVCLAARQCVVVSDKDPHGARTGTDTPRFEREVGTWTDGLLPAMATQTDGPAEAWDAAEGDRRTPPRTHDVGC